MQQLPEKRFIQKFVSECIWTNSAQKVNSSSKSIEKILEKKNPGGGLGISILPLILQGLVQCIPPYTLSGNASLASIVELTQGPYHTIYLSNSLQWKMYMCGKISSTVVAAVCWGG